MDELVLLDITATREGRGPDLGLVEELTAGCFMPLAVGGGVRNLEDVRALLRAGADKVVLRTAGPEVCEQVAKVVGCQAVVYALDVSTLDHNPKPADRHTIAEAVRAALRWQDAGAGEILLTRVEREGAMTGYDLELVSAVAHAVDIPVIAHGGAGTCRHMLEAVHAGASAVAAGSMFQFTDATPKGAAQFLKDNGVEARA